jgi:hypothetical protein
VDVQGTLHLRLLNRCHNDDGCLFKRHLISFCHLSYFSFLDHLNNHSQEIRKTITWQNFLLAKVKGAESKYSLSSFKRFQLTSLLLQPNPNAKAFLNIDTGKERKRRTDRRRNQNLPLILVTKVGSEGGREEKTRTGMKKLQDLLVAII